MSVLFFMAFYRSLFKNQSWLELVLLVYYQFRQTSPFSVLLLQSQLPLVYLLLEPHCNPGPGCSKLTMSLVNVSLKFQTLISQIRQYFLLKKCEKLLQCKSFPHIFNENMSVFGYKVVKHLTS